MGKSEENWKGFFEGAEAPPSDSVWANIDRDLAMAEGKSMKRRIVVYQRIAAASILFALLVGLFGIYGWKESNPSLAKQIESKRNSSEQKQKHGPNGIEQNLSSSKPIDKAKKINPSSLKQKPSKASSEATTLALVDGQKKLLPSDTKQKNRSGGIENLKKEMDNQLSYTSKVTSTDKNFVPDRDDKKLFHYAISAWPMLELLPIAGLQGEPVMVELVRKLPAIPSVFMNSKPDKIMHEKLWASVTAATGSYNSTINSYAYSNPNYNAVGQTSLSSNSSSSSIVGTSYSFGMLAGMRVAKRFVLQSGVQYINQSSGSASNINSSNSLSSVANYIANPKASAYATTSAYNIISANEFVSVPVQAGYLLVDKKVGLQLNSGVSTDFFIRNTLSDPSGQRQSYSQAAGQDSPYRSVNFSGLMSSEVSYKLGYRYRVSLVPGFRYSFQSILKSNTSSNTNPLVWDVGFRLRYIFK